MSETSAQNRSEIQQQLAKEIYADGEPQAIYDSIVRHSVDLIDGCDHASLMLKASGRYMTIAASDDDVWSWIHSYAFDFSVWEILGPLASGGAVVVLDEDRPRDDERHLVEVRPLGRLRPAGRRLHVGDRHRRAAGRDPTDVLGDDRPDQVALGDRGIAVVPGDPVLRVPVGDRVVPCQLCSEICECQGSASDGCWSTWCHCRAQGGVQWWLSWKTPTPVSCDSRPSVEGACCADFPRGDRIVTLSSLRHTGVVRTLSAVSQGCELRLYE